LLPIIVEVLMKIELLVSPGCSSREETETALREILSELAPEATFQTVVVDSPEKAAAFKFPGSPTVRIDGQDLEPEADNSLDYGFG
jgi:hypothetical protein